LKYPLSLAAGCRFPAYLFWHLDISFLISPKIVANLYSYWICLGSILRWNCRLARHSVGKPSNQFFPYFHRHFISLNPLNRITFHR
jgi:hypothetical protein